MSYMSHMHHAQVVCEVYATHPVRCEPHIMLSLILYKMVDSTLEVCDYFGLAFGSSC